MTKAASYMSKTDMAISRVLPMIWKQEVKTEDLWNVRGRRSGRQFPIIIISALYFNLETHILFCFIILSTYLLVLAKLMKYFPWTQHIQKILQNTTGCLFTKNLVFQFEVKMTPCHLAEYVSGYPLTHFVKDFYTHVFGHEQCVN